MNTQPAPTVGQRVTLDGVEYVVNRVTIESKSKRQEQGRGEPPERPTRAQIDLIPVVEAERRQANLQALLEGREVHEY